MSPTDRGKEHTTFQLEDHIYLDYHSISSDTATPAVAWRHDTSGFCESLIRLRELSLQSSHILSGIRKHHADIAHYLAILDKKIDILAQLAGTLGLGGEISPNQHVRLGADGMTFVGGESMQPGERVSLKMVLFPSHLCLHLEARVRACQALDRGHRVTLEFDLIGETEHEALIRHLLERQSAELRRERGE